MRSKKVIALLISLTLLVSSVLPGTLAVSIDQEQQDQNEQQDICTCGSTDDKHAEGCPLYEAPKTLTTPAPEKTCTCGSTNDTHTEDCPLYEAPDTLATPAPVSDPAAKTLKIKITMDSASTEKPYVLVDVTGPSYSKRVAVQVNGGATVIAGLSSGEYTCTVVTGWSWQYEQKEMSVTTSDENNTEIVSFSITPKRSRQWLDGDTYSKNEFANN